MKRTYNNIIRILRTGDGFTLIEIMVALAIGTLIMIMVHSAHRSVLISVRSVTENTQFHENVNLAVRRMTRDIECAVISPDNKFIQFKGENQITPPKRGSISFVTVNRSENMISGDLRSEYRQTDVKSVQYYLRPDKKYQGLFFLMRIDKNLYDTKNDDDNSSPSTPKFESLLLENVIDMEFEFSAGTDWNSKWEMNNALPTAIRTTIKVKDFKGKDQTFIFLANPAANRKDLK
jgi:prepilin-type N-terminal cleavage/methylation domain-containing protein